MQELTVCGKRTNSNFYLKISVLDALGGFVLAHPQCMLISLNLSETEMFLNIFQCFDYL